MEDPQATTIGTDVAILQWKARHDPAMWRLLKRAAVAASHATSSEPRQDAVVEQLAEDIIHRATHDLSVYSLLQQAARAAAKSSNAANTTTHDPPPPHSYPPIRDDSPHDTLPDAPVMHGGTDMEKVLAEALGLTDMKDQTLAELEAECGGEDGFERHLSNVYAGMNLDGASVLSSDTEGPMPIIPIVSSPERRRAAALRSVAPPPEGGVNEAHEAHIHPNNASSLEEVTALTQARMSSEDFAAKLKTVLDRYRQRVAQKAMMQEQPRVVQPPPPPAPTVLPAPVTHFTTTGSRMELLKAAFEGGALDAPAFAEAVSALNRPGGEAQRVIPAPPLPEREVLPQRVPSPAGDVLAVPFQKDSKLLSPMPQASQASQASQGGARQTPGPAVPGPVVPVIPVPVGVGVAGAKPRMVSPMRPAAAVLALGRVSPVMPPIPLPLPTAGPVVVSQLSPRYKVF